MMKPIHDHDCSQCQFLGTVVMADGRTADWYRHPKTLKGSVTIVARYSSDGADYSSMPLSMLSPERVTRSVEGIDGYSDWSIVAFYMHSNH
jgi:hypothetical protein